MIAEEVDSYSNRRTMVETAGMTSSQSLIPTNKALNDASAPAPATAASVTEPAIISSALIGQEQPIKKSSVVAPVVPLVAERKEVLLKQVGDNKLDEEPYDYLQDYKIAKGDDKEDGTLLHPTFIQRSSNADSLQYIVNTARFPYTFNVATITALPSNMIAHRPLSDERVSSLNDTAFLSETTTYMGATPTASVSDPWLSSSSKHYGYTQDDDKYTVDDKKRAASDEKRPSGSSKTTSGAEKGEVEVGGPMGFLPIYDDISKTRFEGKYRRDEKDIPVGSSISATLQHDQSLASPMIERLRSVTKRRRKSREEILSYYGALDDSQNDRRNRSYDDKYADDKADEKHFVNERRDYTPTNDKDIDEKRLVRTRSKSPSPQETKRLSLY